MRGHQGGPGSANGTGQSGALTSLARHLIWLRGRYHGGVGYLLGCRIRDLRRCWPGLPAPIVEHSGTTWRAEWNCADPLRFIQDSVSISATKDEYWVTVWYNNLMQNTFHNNSAVAVHAMIGDVLWAFGPLYNDRAKARQAQNAWSALNRDTAV